MNISKSVGEVFRKHPKLQRTSWENVLGRKKCCRKKC